MADDYSGDTSTTGVLTANSVTTGRIDADFDTDWLRFDARAGGHYRFSVVSPSAAESYEATITPSIYVYDANGYMLPIYENGLLEPVTDGVYYVSVSNGSTKGSYAIRATALDDDYGAVSATAPTFYAGGSTSGTINYTGDTDRFKISLTADNYYTFKLSASTTAAAETIMLNIISATGGYVGSANPAYTQDGARVTIRPTVTGDYYVDALHSPYNNTATPIAYTLSASGPFKDEHGDTPATSTLTTLGDTLTGSLQNSADVDVFKVMLTAGRTYGISWTSPASNQSNPYRISMEVSDATGKYIGGATYSDLTYKTVTPTVTGYHYVKLGGREGDYTMSIAQATDDYTANTSTTGRLTVGGQSAGKLEVGGSDRDWFAVKLTAGTTYWLSAKSETYTYGQLRLLDSSGRELLQSTNSGGGNMVDTLAYVPTRSATYYVEVSSPSMSATSAVSYTVSAVVGEADDHGGTPATATTLTVDQSAAGKLEIARDTDTFKLSVQAGQTYGLTPSGAGQNNLNLNASDALGNYVSLSYWYNQNSSSGRAFTATTTGEVFVTVSGYQPGQYKLTATQFAADDFGPDASSAGVISATGSVQGSLSNPLDRDVLRVSLQAGKSYVFELLGATSGNGTLDVSNQQFSVTGVNYGDLQATMLRNSAEPRIMVTPSTTGDYLINVSSYNGQMGSYTVKALTLTGDATAPVLVASSHANNATGIPITASKIELTFNEPIAIDRAAITLKDSTGQVVSPAYTSGASSPYANDTKLVFNVGGFLTPGTYTLSLPKQSVHDLAGNAYQGPETLTFTTVMPTTVATGGADLLAPNRGGTIDGGGGIDTVIYGADVYIQQFDRTGNTAVLTTYQNNGTKVVDTLVDVERVLFGHQAYALDVDGTAGQAYRLYRAAFDRSPDAEGLGFWIAQMDEGMSLNQVAGQFLSSPESIRLYGDNTSDTQFVTQLYRNVLDREPEDAGLQSWLKVLANGMSRAEVLTGFSQSAENIGAVAPLIGEGFGYTLWL